MLINPVVFAYVLMPSWPTAVTEVVVFLLPLVFWCLLVFLSFSMLLGGSVASVYFIMHVDY